MSYEEILERIQKAKALADSKKRKFDRGEIIFSVTHLISVSLNQVFLVAGKEFAFNVDFFIFKDNIWNGSSG